MNDVFFQSFIDVDSWNNAKWKGIVYIMVPDKYPYVCLLFENEAEGKKIFDGWIKRLGKEDKYDELYLSIVEGEIKGKESGYSVLISSDPIATKKRADDERIKLDISTIIILSRIIRMNPLPESKNLLNFKEKYQVQGRYTLLPAFVDNRSGSPQVIPDFSRGILKKKVVLKNVKEVGENDIEMAIF